MVNGLFTPKRIVDALEQSDQVKDLSYMVVMMAGEGDFKETEYSKYLHLYVVGANNAKAVGELTNDMISMDPALVDDFFASDRMECIVNEKVLKKRGWEIGDRIILKCYYYDASSEFHRLEIHPMGGVVEVDIVGTMEDIMGKTNAIGTDIVIPARTAQNIFAQFELPFFADTVSFHVKDPLNLGAFKEQMLLVLLGNLVGDLVMVLTAQDLVMALSGPAVSTLAAGNGVILIAYLIGAAAAYGRMSRGSVVYLLSTQH